MAYTPILCLASAEIHIRRWSTADLTWGYTDCFRFVGEWITSNGGPDLFSAYKYKNEREAIRCIKRAGYRSLEEHFDRYLQECDPCEGAIIAAPSKGHLPAMGIYHDGKVWAYGDDGKIIPMETEIKRAWVWQ